MIPPDRILKMFNELKQFLYGSALNESNNLLDITLEYTNRGQYELRYLIKAQYTNNSILYEAIVDCTEQLNEWYDFSQHGDDFRVIIDLHEGENKTHFNYNFFELIWEIEETKYSHIVGYGNDSKELLFRDNSRYKRYREWRVEHKEKLSRFIEQKKQESNKFQKGFFTRIKEKLFH
jgi:hypothetical protein